MRLEISEKFLNSLQANKKKMLLLKGHVYAIEDFSIEVSREQRVGFFGTPHSSSCIFLTKIDVVTYFNGIEERGYLRNEKALELVLNFNLFEMRENWVNLRKQIEGLGYKIVKSEEVPEQRKCCRLTSS